MRIVIFMQIFAAIKEQLQLIGITAMFIASKYEEIDHPDAQHFTYITANSYSTDQVYRMERLILRSLNYKLFYPTPIVFLRWFSRIAKVREVASSSVKCLAHYSTFF